MENGTTKSQSLEAKIKTTSLTIYGDDFRSEDTESQICNIVYDKIGTTGCSGLQHFLVEAPKPWFA